MQKMNAAAVLGSLFGSAKLSATIVPGILILIYTNMSRFLYIFAYIYVYAYIHI